MEQLFTFLENVRKRQILANHKKLPLRFAAFGVFVIYLLDWIGQKGRIMPHTAGSASALGAT